MPDTFAPLPSDGVPHVIPDVEGAEVPTCNCTDCRVARLVEVERRLAAVLSHTTPRQRAVIMSPAPRVRSVLPGRRR